MHPKHERNIFGILERNRKLFLRRRCWSHSPADLAQLVHRLSGVVCVPKISARNYRGLLRDVDRFSQDARLVGRGACAAADDDARDWIDQRWGRAASPQAIREQSFRRAAARARHAPAERSLAQLRENRLARLTVMIERDEEFETRPRPDPVREAACPLIECVLELTADGSKERARAVSEVLEVVERIRAALAPKPTIN